MINIELSYADWTAQIDSKSLDHFSYINNGDHKLISIDGPMVYTHDLYVDDESDYNTNYLPSANPKVGNFYSREPFATKVLKSGKSLFRRKHGYKLTIPANSENILLVPVPYDACKINKLEIIDANPLDRIDLMVLDTPTGLLSTIPNYLLNQFGFDVVVSELLYSDKSDYDADLIRDMQVKVVYKNDTNVDKTVGFNIIFHEVK